MWGVVGGGRPRVGCMHPARAHGDAGLCCVYVYVCGVVCAGVAAPADVRPDSFVVVLLTDRCSFAHPFSGGGCHQQHAVPPDRTGVHHAPKPAQVRPGLRRCGSPAPASPSGLLTAWGLLTRGEGWVGRVGAAQPATLGSADCQRGRQGRCCCGAGAAGARLTDGLTDRPWVALHRPRGSAGGLRPATPQPPTASRTHGRRLWGLRMYAPRRPAAGAGMLSLAPRHASSRDASVPATIGAVPAPSGAALAPASLGALGPWDGQLDQFSLFSARLKSCDLLGVHARPRAAACKSNPASWLARRPRVPAAAHKGRSHTLALRLFCSLERPATCPGGGLSELRVRFA
jgi:hypothetical protein